MARITDAALKDSAHRLPPDPVRLMIDQRVEAHGERLLPIFDTVGRDYVPWLVDGYLAARVVLGTATEAHTCGRQPAAIHAAFPTCLDIVRQETGTVVHEFLSRLAKEKVVGGRVSASTADELLLEGIAIGLADQVMHGQPAPPRTYCSLLVGMDDWDDADDDAF